MSMIFYLLLNGDTPLHTDMINSEIKTSYSIIYESGVNLQNHSGFLPVILENETTGVEFYYIPKKTYLAEYPIPEEQKDDIEHVLMLRWGGNIQSALVAIKTSIVFSTMYNALIFDTTGHTFLETNDLIGGYDELKHMEP